MAVLFGLVVSSANAQVAPTTIDLSVRKTISNQNPALGDILTYTVVVANRINSATATGVVVKDELPVDGVTYVPQSATVIRGSGSYTASTGLWTVGTIAPNDSSILILKATVLGRGVWFNTAEVVAANQTDIDSAPNNQSLIEDDYDAICFSVPILWYPGDEYTVTVPSGYDQIVWYRNDQPISTSALSTSLAVVNADLSLTLKSPGTYRFVTYRNGCPATNCCNIEVLQGPYGSLGDLAFIDSNKNGRQDPGETGIDGVTVYLYNQAGTTKLDSTITAGGGLYKFDSLTDGSYTVRFIAPSGLLSTTANVGGVPDNLDSDAGLNGFTGVYTIDTTQPESSTARNNPTVDAGYYVPTASLGDKVFVDANKDGLQQPAEPGIPGVVVVLLDGTMSPIASTTTNASGIYSFTGLTVGVPYSVSFVAPTGYVATQPNVGSNDAIDSDIDPLTGKTTQMYTLTAGENNTTVDAGFYLPTASLGDKVFVDANKDGLQQPDEPGIPGVVVVLLDGTMSPIASTTTNASGIYSFTGLTVGVPYSVSFVAPTGYVSTLANVGGNDAIDSDADPLTGKTTQMYTLTAGENNTTVDAGFYIPTASLGDKVFVDTNKDGLQQPAEPGIPGVVVVLLDGSMSPIASTTTNASGIYSFTGLTVGVPYSVSFVTPTGYVSTLANVGGNDAIDSDIDPLTGKTTQMYTLTAGENNTTVDAGFYIPTASLGDKVFVDANKDGLQQPDEPGIPGVVVVLLDGTMSPIASTTTNASGLYSFTGLTVGVPYSVSFVTPTGYVTAQPNVGSNDAIDSDIDPLTGKTTQMYTLTAGENNTTVDAGFYIPTASLGDKVFVDANKDGLQQPAEPGIPGVVVVLLDGTMSPIASTTTNASGIYSFTGLTVGVPYSVSFVAPTGYVSTLANVGGNDTIDSDADPLTGKTTQMYTLTAGENNTTVDAGFYIPTASLGDKVFVDANKDGLQQPAEPGIPGVVVVLLDGSMSPIASTTTNASGIYSFTGLTVGVPYSVSFVAPTGYVATQPNVGSNDAIDSDIDPLTGKTTQMYTLTAGENNTTVDAGFYIPTASLGDKVFVDANKDGLQQPDEPGIPGVVVVLLDGTMSPIASTTTNASGIYSFTGLTVGVPYSVSFVAPTGYVSTLANVGGNDTIDSDADPLTGKTTQMYTLTAGENNTTVDAGFYIPTASLGDKVFVDANKDGLQQPAEPGIPGVVVVLLDGTMSPIASTTTNASGIYSFTGLTVGVPYSVSFVAPTGYVSTLANVGGNDTIDSDADPLTGKTTQMYTLTAGENNTTVDAGFYIPTASLGDKVFVDANKDGLQQPAEPGIPGVVVVLLDGTMSPIASTTTNASGIYSFTGLTVGVPYSVSFVTPTGYVTAQPNVGSNDAIDSDIDPLTGKTTQMYTLTAGENNTTVDAGFYIPTASLGDKVFVDANKDGLQQPAEPGIPGVVVVLLDGTMSPIASTTTNASGIYSFTGLTVGVPYSVSFVAPTGYVSTLANVGGNDALDSDADPLTGKTTQMYTLTAGENNTTVDAGFYIPTASLGDKVFVDANKDGLQQPAEPGIPGVVVVLLDGTMSPIASTTTNASGIYSFTGLTVGVPYSVSFVTPTGYVTAQPNVGSNDAIDSDIDPLTGKTTQMYTLMAGENNTTVDAGFYIPTASLGDKVFVDANKDGLQQPAEPGIPGVVVVLLDGTMSPIASTTTNASGIYSFTGLTVGVPYSVSFVAPTGYVATQPNVGSNDAIDSDIDPLTGKTTQMYTLTAGENNTTVDAGFYIPTASLGDKVFVDANKDGLQQPAEPGIPGVVVVLLDGTMSPIASTTTNASGIYSFTGLTVGVPYSVSFVTPTGYVTAQPNVGSNDAIDSDIDPLTGKTTQMYTLMAGENNTTVDAGYYIPTASLGDFVFLDNDSNGQQGGVGEVGVSGIKVTLYATGVTAPVATTTTGADGKYLFTNLTPGTGYYVVFDTTGLQSRNLMLTAANQGPDQTDSDADGVTGRTGTYILAPGEINLTVDAGLKPFCPTNFSLVASIDASICNGEKTQLVASTPIQNATIKWYLTPYDGVAFATVSSEVSITVSPTTTTVYYAAAVAPNGCVSPRKPVVVTVTTVPTPICLGNVKNTCPERTVDLTKIIIENQSTGLTYEWYTSIDRSPATRIINTTAVGAGKVYLFAKSATGCYSNPTVLTVEIVDCNCQNVAGVTAGPGVAICSGDQVPVKAILSGSATSVTWSSNGTGTFAGINSLNATYTPSVSDIASGSVMLTVTTNDPDGPGGVCTAATSSLIVKINKRPTAPVGVACDDTLVCQGSSTKLIGFAPGSRINWYNQENQLIGTTESGAKLVVTPSRAGAIVYTAEAISPENCVSNRTSLTVTVGSCLADLTVLKQVVTTGTYSIGQKITYSITATNNGPITGTNVSVKDILPPALTYVSSTPVGEYNVATGIWTIGSLTKGSNRSLLVEATINAAGSIRNTAIIGGPNNDPKYPQNDTSSVTIETLRCDVKAPVITCAITEICKDGSTILKASGCIGGLVKWSDGQSGFDVTVSPKLTTSYSASCVINGCTSPAATPILITVTEVAPPVITVSPTASICPGASVTLTASGCVGGVIEWSEKGQTGASIVVTPYGKTTYTAQCRIANCLSSPVSKVIDVTTDLPTPTITGSTTAVCPGESVTLTVNGCTGTPIWSSTTLTTGSIIVTPTVGTNTYTVYCKTASCASKSSLAYTINVTAPAVPTVTASTDSVCVKGVVSLTATGCNGTIVWNTTDKNGVSLTGSVISVTPEASTSYYAQCKVRTCLSDPSRPVTVTVLNPSAPIIKADKSLICSGEKVTLTAEGCAGIVKWYGIERIGASIDIYPGDSKEYYATCKQATCESEPSNLVRITVKTSGTAPKITASSTVACSGGILSMTATGCSEGVIWSDGQTGSVISITATPSNTEYYAMCKSTTQCGSPKSNVIKINVTPVPTPTVVCSTTEVCPGEAVTLTVANCQGTPYWSTKETTKSIIVTPRETTAYSVYCQDGVCRSELSAQYTIKVVPVAAPTIVASATSVVPGGTITLTATGCAGEVIWSATDINGNNKGASIVVRPEGMQTYYAQCKYRTCLSDPSITIVVNKGNCVAEAGTLVPVQATVCAEADKAVTVSATLGGGLIQPTGYSLVYVLTKGDALVIAQTGDKPSFTVPAANANYTIHTLVYNANPADKDYLDLSLIKAGITTGADVLKLIADKKVCADLDVTGAKVAVKFPQPPVLSVSSQTVCSGSSVTFSALGCEAGVVQWSDGSTGNTISKVAYSNLVMTATCTLNGCISKPATAVNVTLGTPGVPTIASDKATICLGETVTLTATGCVGGTYIWSDDKTVGSTLTVSPTANVSYRVKCKIGTCESTWSPSTTIKVGSPTAPTISVAGSTPTSSATVCFGSPVTLTAQGCPANSYVTWSNDLVGTSITVSLAASGNFTARCCTSANCKSVPSNSIAITVLPKVTPPQTVDRTNTCPFTTVDLTTGVTSKASTTGGIFEYYTSATLSPATKVGNTTVAVAGVYYAVEKTVDGCYSLPSLIHVLIKPCTEVQPCDVTNPAQANAGPDASICAAKTYQLSGTMGGSAKTAHWSTSGSGTFSDPFATNAVYTASAADVLAGKVTLTLSVSTNNAACAVAKDDMILTIESSKVVPVVTVRGATNFCFGDSVTLIAPAGGTYLWSNSAKTQQIVVKNSGSYNVQLIDPKGCSSMKSADVVVTVAEPTPIPLVSSVRNICPAVVANLTKAVSETVIGNTYEYRIGPLRTSAMVMRPDSVGAGTYYVFAKNTTGCVSAPAKVTVNIFNCVADSMKTDLQIVKKVNKLTVTVGEVVTYTLKVTNLGPDAATNVEVQDALPKGVEFLATSTTGYAFVNGSVYRHIDKLKAGQSDSISFSVRVIAKGAIRNQADITYLDQRDTRMANNWDDVTITSSAYGKASQIGLAKAVMGTPTTVGDSLIKVTYGFVLSNFGNDTLRRVQVIDDLASVFAPNAIVSAVVTPKTTGSTLVVNPAYTGANNNTQLFDQASYLAPGRSQLFTLAVVVKRAAGDTTRTFRNIASVTALNSLTTVSDLSTDGGDTDPDGDGDPTNNSSRSSFTLGTKPVAGPGIGVALTVVKIVPQADGSYNVTYKATIKNTGDVPLTGVSLSDSLVRTFAAPASYTVVSPPVVAPGSHLVANAGFNGNTQTNMLTNASKLSVGEQDTLLVTVRIAPNGNNGPFFSTATATATTTDLTQTVKDISNNGVDPVKPGAVSTPVRFDLPKGLLGVAKSVGTPILVQEGVYDIPYTIKLSNMGTTALRKVQVVDNLSQTFGHGALVVSNRIAVSAGAGLTVDTLYTGQGLITKMLVDSLSTLPVGATSSLNFTVRVNVKNADSLTFYNTAMATALTDGNVLVEDMSTAGINDDPDNDLDPRNNSTPTPVSLNSETSNAYIGISMAVRDTIRQANGSFNVTYQVVLKNYGRTSLTNVSVTDSLSKVFSSATGATYTIVKAPYTVSTGSALTINPDFNGSTDARIVIGDSLSTLAASKVDTVLFTLNIVSDGSTTTFLNSAVAQAKSGTVVVSDISTSGLDPDLNGNNNPTDLNEREATPLNLPSTSTALFIPEGFSPNGDGINDLFVIRGVGSLTISIEVYNRWQHLVYKNDDYKNDWDGKPNTGITISDGATGLPDGTYYYVIKTSDGRKFVRYMTINR
ncbi:SdrD B-like domain-containing protein [Spirosoma rigui]|uniref:SdrD B-like domain-containing protein n=1 Tax=Spirosoma rigui TaxID=564064 RepID=UPI001FE253FE|nr:SdrD B-like domain-containing protein [Spirosoma rigui]